MKLDFSTMPDHSRIWVYQCSRELSDQEIELITKKCDEFTDSWSAHGSPLQASYALERKRFLVLAVDEEASGVTGCSIDASVALVRELGELLSVDFFDRMAIAWIKEGGLAITQMHEFWAMRKAGLITDETRVFNNLVKTKGELREGWLVPFAQSWHAEMW